MSPDVPEVVAFVFAVVAVVAIPATAVAAPTATTADAPLAPQTTGNDTANGTVAPGQRLAGVVGVQSAEIDGELQERALSTRLSRADSNASKAAVIATDLNQIRDRLQRLRERQEALRERHRAGELSTGEYAARMAITSAEIRSLQTQIESNERATRGLPDAALESKGVDREELDRLRSTAAALQGPEVADLARRIAGERPGRELDPEPGPDELPDPARSDDPADRGAPDDGPPANGGAGNRSTSTGGGQPADPGNSSEAGDGASGSGDPGKSDGASGSGDPGKSGDPGQSDESGNGDGGGNSGADGQGRSDWAPNDGTGGDGQ